MIVVTDSTILIGLAKLGKLTLLKETFSNVSIPEEVFKEVVERGKTDLDLNLLKNPPGLRQRQLKTKHR